MSLRRPPRPNLGGQAPATKLVTAGRPDIGIDPYVNPPLARASTILFPSIDALNAASAAPEAGLYYGRRGTPTHWALEDALTALEPDAAGARLCPSGVAAITTSLLAVLSPGDELLVTDSAYEPSRVFADNLLARQGITTRYFDPRTRDIAALLSPATKAILLESPGSLTFELHDLPAITKAARANNITTLIDNTWATPLRLQPLALGVDVSIQSATKYIGGHSDLLMGVITATAKALPSISKMHRMLGQAVGADDASLALRGLRTMAVRLDRHEASGLEVARWLENHPAVHAVLHPALPSHPDHAIYQRDFIGSTGLFAVALTPGTRADLAALLDNLHHFGLGFSWGGFESLALPIGFRGNRSATTPDWPGPLVRLSIGLEDPADLIADLKAGLDNWPKR